MLGSFDTNILVLTILLGFLIASLPKHASAQADRRAYHKINIAMEGGECLYEIENHQDQDLFEIEPLGVVDFVAVDTDALVTVENSPDGTSGTVGDRRIKVRDGHHPKSLRARPARGASSRHKVRIECCNSGWFWCSNKQPAQERPLGVGAAENALPLQYAMLPDSDPHALVPARPVPLRLPPPIPGPLALGGPVMEVDD